MCNVGRGAVRWSFLLCSEYSWPHHVSPPLASYIPRMPASNMNQLLLSPRLFVIGILAFSLLSIHSVLHRPQQIPFQGILRHDSNHTVRNSATGFKAISKNLEAVHNSTLGFQKIFVINLPERTDKLDTFSVVSSLTGFAVEVIKGVKGRDVQNKSLPALEGLPTAEAGRNNIVGCWRAHMNFAQTIVTNGLSSALVLEDDADWDVTIKDQLRAFASGSQFVTAVPKGHKPHSPYGDDWDLLWLGHCASTIMPDHDRRWVIENDATVPDPKHRVNFAGIPDMAASGYDNSTRVVYRASDGVCLYAYALSFRGACKVLRGQALRKTFTPIDVGIGQLCKEKEFKCISVFPQLIDSHKAAGRMSRDSDIGRFSPSEVRQKGFTYNIVHSMRLNMDRLLTGENATIVRQWPDDPIIDGPLRQRPMGKRTE
ncbi:hypothetical protein N7G274_007672 [Stereocaulon virgatum]|uniref:Glycosyltransferase family 25 protein n=1 Tax=Stereocaulon virgatum TaxID=373712 RepID=A0ABR4A1U6_9LECA